MMLAPESLLETADGEFSFWLCDFLMSSRADCIFVRWAGVNSPRYRSEYFIPCSAMVAGIDVNAAFCNMPMTTCGAIMSLWSLSNWMGVAFESGPKPTGCWPKPLGMISATGASPALPPLRRLPRCSQAELEHFCSQPRDAWRQPANSLAIARERDRAKLHSGPRRRELRGREAWYRAGRRRWQRRLKKTRSAERSLVRMPLDRDAGREMRYGQR